MIFMIDPSGCPGLRTPGIDTTFIITNWTFSLRMEDGPGDGGRREAALTGADGADYLA
ncbi:MAG TPA: hypothetical protein VKT17_08730 [Acidobacteriota bacterium]|nr:hypothetical protein [Acidobacteriota bacterium]